MESIKRFLLEEKGSSEAASSVILIAAVGGLLLVAITAYYGAMNGFFTKVQTWITTETASTWNVAS